MVRIYEVTGDGHGPWAKGDRVAYSPFRKERAVVIIYRVGLVTEYGLNLVPAVRQDVAARRLRLLEEHLDPHDETFLSDLCAPSVQSTEPCRIEVPALTVH
jgi:hypothetical protein